MQYAKLENFETVQVMIPGCNLNTQFITIIVAESIK